LRDELAMLPDAEEKFEFLLDAGRDYPPLDEALKTDDRLIPGCVSQLWLAPEMRDGKCFFGMDATALTSKGIAAVVCNLYNDASPAEVVEVGVEFFGEVGLHQVISPNRRNGLSNLRARIKQFAVAQMAQSAP